MLKNPNQASAIPLKIKPHMRLRVRVDSDSYYGVRFKAPGGEESKYSNIVPGGIASQVGVGVHMYQRDSLPPLSDHDFRIMEDEIAESSRPKPDSSSFKSSKGDFEWIFHDASLPLHSVSTSPDVWHGTRDADDSKYIFVIFEYTAFRSKN